MRTSEDRTVLPVRDDIPLWPVLALIGGFAVWWFLGLGGFIWPLLAVPMTLTLLAVGHVRAPRGFGIWVLFLLWMGISFLRVEDASGLVFLHRVSLYGSATILFLYVYNAPEPAMPRIVNSLGLFWATIVLLGLAALVAPGFSIHSLFESALPESVARNSYIHELVHVRLAQVHEFLGYPVSRPAAPFTYTNEWGACLSLLTPFVLLLIQRGGPWRRIGPLLVLAAVPPLVVSLNRGTWLALTLGVAYAGVRLAMRGRMAAIGAMVLSVLVVGVLIVATPLGGLLEDRLTTPHSNEGRFEIYGEVLREVGESPVFGYGAPRPSESDPALPYLGTHGAIWLVLFSHGIPGAVFFLAFFLIAFWRTRQLRTWTELWCHVVVVVGIIMLPYYGFLPAQIHLVMVAAAIGMRQQAPPVPDPAAAGTTPRARARPPAARP